MSFEKKDMDGTWYEWHQSGTEDKYTGTPSRRRFDPSNGYQVLFLINTFASFIDRKAVHDLKRIEHQLYNHLPIGIKSEISVFNWLKSVTVF